MGLIGDITARLRGTEDTNPDDMELIDYRHLVSLSFQPAPPSPLRAHAIGWLGSKVRSEGQIDQTSMVALLEAYEKQRTDTGELGHHTCGICRHYQDRGEFVVQASGRSYVLPRMVLHYIQAHNYLPPQAFLSDLRAWSEHQRPKGAEPLGAGDAGLRHSANPEPAAGAPDPAC